MVSYNYIHYSNANTFTIGGKVMGVLGKDLLDLKRPLTHTKVQFGEKLYWIENNPKGIPYGTVLTELLNYDASAYIEAVQQFRDAAER